ncbi:MAG: hypothetical protein ACP5S8_07600 [Hydrogenobaculum sp.]
MIELKINGKTITLKDFPSKALESTIIGFIKALKLEEEPTEVKILIKKDATDKDNP